MSMPLGEIQSLSSSMNLLNEEVHKFVLSYATWLVTKVPFMQEIPCMACKWWWVPFIYRGHQIYMVRIKEVKGTKHKGIMTGIREEEVNLHVVAFACLSSL